MYYYRTALCDIGVDYSLSRPNYKSGTRGKLSVWAGAFNPRRMRPPKTDSQILPTGVEGISYLLKGSENSQETCWGYIEKETTRSLPPHTRGKQRLVRLGNTHDSSYLSSQTSGGKFM